MGKGKGKGGLTTSDLVAETVDVGAWTEKQEQALEALGMPYWYR